MQTYSTISMLPLKRQKVKTEMPFDIFSPPAPRSEDGSAGGGMIWFRATTRAARGQSGFCSKKVRISSNRHHYIELVASLGASPLALAGSFASKSKGFLKSISSRSAARRRFIPQMRDIAQRAMSRFFLSPLAKGKARFY